MGSSRIDERSFVAAFEKYGTQSKSLLKFLEQTLVARYSEGIPSQRDVLQRLLGKLLDTTALSISIFESYAPHLFAPLLCVVCSSLNLKRNVRSAVVARYNSLHVAFSEIDVARALVLTRQQVAHVFECFCIIANRQVSSAVDFAVALGCWLAPRLFLSAR